MRAADVTSQRNAGRVMCTHAARRAPACVPQRAPLSSYPRTGSAVPLPRGAAVASARSGSMACMEARCVGGARLGVSRVPRALRSGAARPAPVRRALPATAAAGGVKSKPAPRANDDAYTYSAHHRSASAPARAALPETLRRLTTAAARNAPRAHPFCVALLPPLRTRASRAEAARAISRRSSRRALTRSLGAVARSAARQARQEADERGGAIFLRLLLQGARAV